MNPKLITADLDTNIEVYTKGLTDLRYELSNETDEKEKSELRDLIDKAAERLKDFKHTRTVKLLSPESMKITTDNRYVRLAAMKSEAVDRLDQRYMQDTGYSQHQKQEQDTWDAFRKLFQEFKQIIPLKELTKIPTKALGVIRQKVDSLRGWKPIGQNKYEVDLDFEKLYYVPGGQFNLTQGSYNKVLEARQERLKQLKK